MNCLSAVKANNLAAFGCSVLSSILMMMQIYATLSAMEIFVNLVSSMEKFSYALLPSPLMFALESTRILITSELNLYQDEAYSGWKIRLYFDHYRDILETRSQECS